MQRPQGEEEGGCYQVTEHRPPGSSVEIEGAADGKLGGRSVRARPHKALSAMLQSLDLILGAVGSKERFPRKE